MINQFKGGLLSSISVQMSCKIPIIMWTTIKEIAKEEGVTATSLVTHSLERLIFEHKVHKVISGIKIGDKITALSPNGQEFINYTVEKKDDVLGIIVTQPGKLFIPLDEFKHIVQGQ